MEYKNKKIIIIVFLIIVLSLIYFFNKERINNIDFELEENNNQEQVLEENNNQNNESENEGNESEEVVIDSTTKEGLLLALDKYGKEEDFENFAKYLLIVYQNQWSKDPTLEAKESEIYMDITEKYFDQGNIEEALRLSTIVYNEVPEGWRFRYLRIRSLEKIGRDAFNEGNLVLAEEKATEILRMMFRVEGSNLMADVYIKKIEDDIASGDIDSAINNLYFIWDYEVSEDRRERLEELKSDLLQAS